MVCAAFSLPVLVGERSRVPKDLLDKISENAMSKAEFDIPQEKLRTQLGPVACYVEGKELLGNSYGTFLGISLVGLLIGGVVPLVLIGPMYCGMILCLITRTTGGQMTFDMLFKGFDYFVQSLIAFLIYMVGMLVLFVPFGLGLLIGALLMSSQQSLLGLVGGLILAMSYIYWVFVAIVAQVFPFLACALIVDKNLEAVPAAKLAVNGIVANFWGVVGTMIVGNLMIFAATLMCFFPVILAIPILFAGHFVVYRKIFGISKIAPVNPQMY